MNEVVNIIMNEENTALNKFNNCKFRSEEEEVRVIKRCSCQGGDYTEHGYFCHKNQIFKLTSDVCENCQLFEHK